MVYYDLLEARLDKCFEVDSTESIWYKLFALHRCPQSVLKLTPQSQYGIHP